MPEWAGKWRGNGERILFPGFGPRDFFQTFLFLHYSSARSDKKGGKLGALRLLCYISKLSIGSDEAKIDPILPICERGEKVQKIMEGPRRELIWQNAVFISQDDKTKKGRKGEHFSSSSLSRCYLLVHDICSSLVTLAFRAYWSCKKRRAWRRNGKNGSHF